MRQVDATMSIPPIIDEGLDVRDQAVECEMSSSVIKCAERQAIQGVRVCLSETSGYAVAERGVIRW